MHNNQTPNNSTLVITALNQRLLTAYGYRFLDTFPETLDLMVWSEDELDIPHRRLSHAFVERNKHRPQPRSYKQDAIRFHWKPQAVYLTYNTVDRNKYTSILWIDADTQFLKQIDQTWIDEHIATEHIMSYMGRPDYYSETGVLYFNLKHKHTEQYIKDVWEYYVTGDIWDLQEQHDSYVWDYVRLRQEHDNNRKFRNLGVDHKVPGGHIQAYLYGEWFDHAKGPRKKSGKSPENKHN